MLPKNIDEFFVYLNESGYISSLSKHTEETVRKRIDEIPPGTLDVATEKILVQLSAALVEVSVSTSLGFIKAYHDWVSRS